MKIGREKLDALKASLENYFQNIERLQTELAFIDEMLGISANFEARKSVLINQLMKHKTNEEQNPRIASETNHLLQDNLHNSSLSSDNSKVLKSISEVSFDSSISSKQDQDIEGEEKQELKININEYIEQKRLEGFEKDTKNLEIMTINKFMKEPPSFFEVDQLSKTRNSTILEIENERRKAREVGEKIQTMEVGLKSQEELIRQRRENEKHLGILFDEKVDIKSKEYIIDHDLKHFSSNFIAWSKAQKPLQNLTRAFMQKFNDNSEDLKSNIPIIAQIENTRFKIDFDKKIEYIYSILAVQYCYITLYFTYFPLAVVLVTLSNFFTIFIVIKYYGSIIKRAVSEEIEGIGIWNRVFKIIGNFAIIFNAIVLLFPAKEVINELFDSQEDGPRNFFFVAIISLILLSIRFLMEKVLSKTPSWVKAKMEEREKRIQVDGIKKDYFWNTDNTYADMVNEEQLSNPILDAL